MEPVLQRGTLIEWNDDRGFGFIQTASHNQKVFLHISDLRRGIRRPQVGDTVHFDISTRADGKKRATSAYLLSVPPITINSVNVALPRVNRRSTHGMRDALFLCLVASVFVLFIANRLNSPQTELHQPSDIPQTDFLPAPGYTIKGNISVGTGRKLYHVPGCEDYDDTIIDLKRGERWFLTEADARASGWASAHR